MRRIILSIFAIATLAGWFQTFSYTPTACAGGTYTYQGVSVTVTCANQYSTMGNSTFRTYDRYALTSGASTRNVAYIHGGPTTGGTTPSTVGSAYNWWSTSANPTGWVQLVVQTGWTLDVINYTLLTSSPSSQQPADRTDVDCYAKFMANSGVKRLSLIGSSWGGYLAAVVNMSGPFSVGNSVCEYTNAYTFDSVAMNSPLVDFVAAYNCTGMANCAQLQGYIQLYLPCSSTPTCTGATAVALSPLNTITPGRARMLMLEGVNDTWLSPAAQSGAFYTALTSAGIPAWYLLQSGTGHLLDEQGGNFAGKTADPTIVNFINNSSRGRSAGSTSIP